MREHHALDTRDDMLAIARLWPDLEDQLAGGGGGGDASGVRSASTTRLPISTAVSDVMALVATWANFLARVLIDETDWQPKPGVTVPALLEDIARNRIGHFTEHRDEMLRLAIADEAASHRRAVTRAIQPSGRRTVRVGVLCVESGCPGQYVVVADPDRPHDVPDMVCNRSREHIIEPLEWQRAARRAGPDGARDIIVRWRRESLDETRSA